MGCCVTTKRTSASKFQNPNPKFQRNPKHQIPKEVATQNAQFGAWDLNLIWDLELGIWDFVLRLPRRLLALSGRGGATACVVDSRSGRARSNAVERFRVDALRARHAIEFGERRIVTEERLQPR